MTREEAKAVLYEWQKMMVRNGVPIDTSKVQALRVAIEALTDPSGANLINRHDATTVIREECWKCNNLINADLLGRILALPTSQQTDCTEFIEWLLEVVLDDEYWELNAVACGEIIARKMKKLGLLEIKDGYYVRPTADRPVIIRSRTLMPTKDFEEWAERIKKQAPNAIVIPVDAETVSEDRPHGKWIVLPYHKLENYSFTAYKCSECGEIVYYGGYNYCYNCGAKMGVEE